MFRPGARNPAHCFVPPYILDHLAASDDPDLRRIAETTRAVTAAARAARAVIATLAVRPTAASASGTKEREVYDMGSRTGPLPGTLVRGEHDPPTGDEAADEAFDGAGTTYDFYREVHGRNSLDDRGMLLRSIVHYGRNLANALWDGEQMLYGDGDQKVFDRFTRSLEVVAHELTHGVIQHTSNPVYEGESGALNESFADVMAMQVEQKARGVKVEQADWWLGGEIILPAVGVKGIRTFTADLAYQDHPLLGTDQQPKHTDQQYEGPDDNGGVHINSGIPNHAFYLVAMRLGGNSWETAGHIWYKTLVNLDASSTFSQAAAMTIQVAGAQYSHEVETIVQAAWKQVGVTPS